MRYFGIIGSSSQIVWESSKEPDFPDDVIEMDGERPTPDHIASVDGTWVLPEGDAQNDS